MGLFGKKKQKEKLPEVPELPKVSGIPKASNLPDVPEYEIDEDYSDMPDLPEFPRLPEFPKMQEEFSNPVSSRLPKYPITKTGNRFSQNTIKEAVTGGKEEEFLADDSDEEQMMPKFPKLNLPINIEKATNSKIRSKSPVFIRVDKFEESLKLFDELKDKVADMEKLMKDIKQVKEKEEKELSEWESEMQSMKNQVEKVEKDLFSKIE